MVGTYHTTGGRCPAGRCSEKARSGRSAARIVETKEQIGAILFLDADDLDQPARLMSKHPGVRAGPFEIRSVADLTEMIRASERRRSAAT